MGKKNNRRSRIIGGTILRVTPLLVGIAIAGNWTLCAFKDDIANLRLGSKLDGFVSDQTIESMEPSIPSQDVNIPGIGEVTFEPETTESPETQESEAPEEELPFERISSELYDMGYEIPEVDFDALNEINPDIQGWIRIDGTKIDFPLIQGEDNQYYLKHDIENNSNVNGSIFLDSRNNSLDEDMLDLNDVSYIYGHHMSSGAMFASLCNFKDQQFLNEHPFGIIKTENGDLYKLDFFAGMVISGVDDSVVYTGDFEDEEEFQSYYDSVKERAMVKNDDVELEFGDKVIALITCSYETDNSRFVLYARITKQLEKVDEVQNHLHEDKGYTLTYDE